MVRFERARKNIYPVVEAVGMWESRRNFQRVWEGWEPGIMAFRAFYTLSFPRFAFRPAILGEPVHHPAQSANPPRNTYRDQSSVSVLAIWHSSRRIPPGSALDLLAKNQGHIASGVLQQLLARNTGLGAKQQTLHQVNERTASHLGRGCASQSPRLHLLFETFRENISGRGEALRDIRTDLRYSLRLSHCCGGHHATAAGPTRSGVDGSLAKGGHGLVEVRLRLKSCD